MNTDIIDLAPTLTALKQIMELQEKMSKSPAAEPGAAQRLELLQQTLQQLPQSLSTVGPSVNAGVGPSAQIADNLWNAANAAEAVARNLSGASAPSMQAPIDSIDWSSEYATGGAVNYLAKGGRGTDTIAAMLSPGEFIVNARSARRFHSQLVAMNAGVSPIFRSQGGDTTTNVGDISIAVNAAPQPEQTGRSIMRILHREIRRGTSRPI